MNIGNTRNYICEFLERKIRRNTYLKLYSPKSNKYIVFKLLHYENRDHLLDLEIELLDYVNWEPVVKDTNNISVYVDETIINKESVIIPNYYIFKLTKGEIMVELL